MMLYKNTKVEVCSLDGDTDFFDIVADVLQGDILSVYNLPKLHTSKVNRSNEIKWFYTKKGKKQMIPLTNYYECRLCRWHTASDKYTYPSQIQLHSLEQAAGGIGLHMNADKIEYICFNQKGDMSTLNDGSLKLVDKFTYLRSSILSTENDINMRLAKTWIVIKRLSIIWKSYFQ